MAVRGAAVLEPVFVREGGRKGRLSMQTNPANYPNTERMLEQGIRFASLAPNIQVKFPATRAGILAIEQATAAGDQHQCHGLLHGRRRPSRSAEAVERGLDALAATGGDIRPL